MMKILWLSLSCCSLSSAFVAPKLVQTANPRTSCVLQVTPADAIAQLDAQQTAGVQGIQAALPDLAAKPDNSWAPGAATIAGAPATLDARDAPGPANVAWLSALKVDGKVSSLTIFNGPLTNVPHLTSRCVVPNESTMHFNLDFRPRAYGAYEMVRPDGTYPGPEELGRQSFEYSGARLEFDNNYGTEAFKANLAAITFDGAVPDSSPPSEVDTLTRGPLCMNLVMPLTDANVAAVAAARNLALESWKSWATDPSHEHRPGAPVNTQYVYDSKFKQNCYSGLLETYSAYFGPDGAALAAAESGPLDEGYVGGGS